MYFLTPSNAAILMKVKGATVKIVTFIKTKLFKALNFFTQYRF